MDSEHQQIWIVALVALVAIVAMVVFVGRGSSGPAGYSGPTGNSGGLAMDDDGGLPEGCKANGAFVRDKAGTTWYGCATDDGTYCMTPNGNADLAQCSSPQ